jgi:hypothetical protein
MGNTRVICGTGTKIEQCRKKANPRPEHANSTPAWSIVVIGGLGKVYVSTDGHAESLFAASARGSRVANWIQTGLDYEFRLNNLDHTKLLAKVVVTRATQYSERG